jgi:hypothetical protein
MKGESFKGESKRKEIAKCMRKGSKVEAIYEKKKKGKEILRSMKEQQIGGKDKAKQEEREE